MTACYLIRLDDACPTMQLAKWIQLEILLDSLEIKPIVAVVPDNQDPKLCVQPSIPFFWDIVRRWQNKGWTIAMHGYQHRFHPIKRHHQIFPFYDHSEFSGLTRSEQAAKICRAWCLFEKQGVTPTVWIAPAHGFDWTTIDVLRTETPIRIVSDGIAYKPFFEENFYWIPQQLWQFKKKMKGVWTICLHPNSMSRKDFLELKISLRESYAKQTVGMADIALPQQKKRYSDHLISFFFWQRHRFILGKQVLKNVNDRI